MSAARPGGHSMCRKALPGQPAAPPPQSAAASAAQLPTERQPPAALSLPLLSPVAVHCSSSESRVLALVAIYTEGFWSGSWELPTDGLFAAPDKETHAVRIAYAKSNTIEATFRSGHMSSHTCHSGPGQRAQCLGLHRSGSLPAASAGA